jgi:4-oxalomesaconate tautomerase
VDEINGIPVSCMDVAMPVVIAKAEHFGLSGYETRQELDDNQKFYAKMEPLRVEAGRRMGLGDVRESVVPKFGLIAPARKGGSICARYFMPWNCHPSMAVTGGQCMAACLLTPGTVGHGLGNLPGNSPERVILEHPIGKLEIIVDYAISSGDFVLHSTGLVRTARKIAAGELFIPSGIWKQGGSMGEPGNLP